jgi:hypothetical protein
LFDPRKEKQKFEEARREFGRERASSSKAQPEVKECGMPLAFDQSASPGDGKEVSKLVGFLYTFIDLTKDERAVQELQHLIRHYEKGRVDPLLNRAIHQVSRKRWTNKELHLNAQIGDYDIYYVVLDLGSKFNVMTKKTWALMGKPKLIYSPIRLMMANQQAVSPFGRLEHVLVEIDGVRMFVDFEVIEIADDNCPYPALLGIDWAFNNLNVVDIKKRRMTFEGDGLRVIAPLDPDEDHRYTNPSKKKTIVGTGVDPGFISKSAPTSPNYWPFRQHLRSRCSLTRSSYEGVAGQRCLQPKGISSGSNTRTTQHSYITYQLRSILHIYLSDLKQ